MVDIPLPDSSMTLKMKDAVEEVAAGEEYQERKEFLLMEIPQNQGKIWWTNWTGHRAQRIIPAEMAKHPVLQKQVYDLKQELK